MICVDDDEFKLLDSVFKYVDLFLNGGILAGKLSIFGSYKIELRLERLELFLEVELFFLIDEIEF